MAKYREEDTTRPVVIYDFENLYIKYNGIVSQKDTIAIVLQETEKAYLMRYSYNYPNVPKEEAEFSTTNMWIPKSKITRIREIGMCYNLGGNKKIVWDD